MRAKNSTNVRIRMALYRAGFRLAGSLAPHWAAAQAEKLFRTPPKREASAAEKLVLARGRRSLIETPQGILVVRTWGQGPKVLLVHGWGGSSGQFHPLIPSLCAAGFSAVAFDAPAHGESSGELSSLPQFAEAILTVDEGHGPFEAIIGHSMGGAAASWAMVQGLQVKRAVYIAPPADAYQWFRNFSDALGFSEELEEETRRRMEERLHFDFSLLNAKELGPRISTPLLVIHDHQDREVAWTEGRTIVQSTHHAQLLSTEGLGHRRILNHPEVIRTAIGFIQNRPAELAIERNFGFCSRCGNELERRGPAEMCEDCEFEFELFDPPARRKARAFDVGNAAV